MGLRGRHVGIATGPRVAEGLAAGLRLARKRLERLRCAPAAIRLALGEQPLGVGAVNLEPLRLPVAGGGWTLVPVEPEPLERLQDGVGVGVRGARAVGVLDPE